MMKVTGEGIVTAQPDKAIITLGVITENPNLTLAQSENNEKITNITNVLVQLGVPREQIKTAEFRIEPQYDYVEGKQVFRSYKVTHLLQITLQQIELIGLVVDTAVSQGANFVGNIQFTLSHPEIAYNQALSLALHDSYRKAVTLTQTLGVTLCFVPQNVTEITTPTPTPLLYSASQLAKSTPTPIEPGQLQVVARITAEYCYR
ncbi:SIMPL domain-containing protein [Brevibacillus ginsengisoli]|uniref:SIMPL domain-containing protein n=1 Tax=Brevibacillus ginsengisoli TaxID=363854 RepID=UPI003CE7662D